MKILFYGICVLTMLTVLGCDVKKTDGNSSMLAMLLMDASSGNCVYISKDSATRYTANGFLIPKGSCNEATFFGTMTTDLNTVKAAFDAFVDAEIAAMTPASCTTSGAIAAATTYKSSVTTAVIFDTANLAASKCYTLIPCNFTYCIGEDKLTAFRDKYRYYITSDVKTDMSINLAHQRGLFTIAQATNRFTTAAIANAVPFNGADMAIMKGPKSMAFLSTSGGYHSCATDLLDSYSDVRSVIIRNSGYVYSSFGITLDEAQAVTTPIVPFQAIQCGYGSTFTPDATIGQCPSTYPEY